MTVSGRMTVGELLEGFLAAPHHWRPATLASHRNVIHHLLADRLTRRRLAALAAGYVRVTIRRWRQEGLSVPTMSARWLILRSGRHGDAADGGAAWSVAATTVRRGRGCCRFGVHRGPRMTVVGCQALADRSGGAVRSALPAATPVATQGCGEGATGVSLALSEAADVWQCVWQRGPPEGYSSDRKWTSEHVYGRSWTVWTGLRSGGSDR
ncbi:hypothetical protein CEDDRAFT_04150 [Frankia sp. CeD]|nr:hypothetical protein BMG523Draft_02378 [Frankia sp. BMG5.23]KEZ34488.1 hypothetical protein CEDDRAFT_04150 [Frankia sp. CeD]